MKNLKLNVRASNLNSRFIARTGDMIEVVYYTPHETCTMVAIVCKGYINGCYCIPITGGLGPDYPTKSWKRYKNFDGNSTEYFIKYNDSNIFLEHFKGDYHEDFYQDTTRHHIEHCSDGTSPTSYNQDKVTTYRIVTYKYNDSYYVYTFLNDEFGAGFKSSDLNDAKREALIKTQICKLEFKSRNLK